MNDRFIYCDHNATTPVHPAISEHYSEILARFGNASSVYQLGRQAKESIELARQTVAEFIGALPDQLIFTSSGSESNNHVLMQALYMLQDTKEPVHILISAIEHSSVKQVAKYVHSLGVDYDEIPVTPTGEIDITAYESLFKPHTKLVSVVLANNEIGTIQDINCLAGIAREKGALFHSDAVQALGKLDINVQELDVDFMSFSAHKINAPKGVGALFMKDELMVKPLLHGGFHERGLRASTENVPGIMAFAQAVKLFNIQHYQAHTEHLISTLKASFLNLNNVIINSHQASKALTNTLNVSFRGCSGYALVMNCDLEGIAVSTGSACSVGSIEPSHVLEAIGVSLEDNKSSVRFSVGMSNTHEEMDVVVNRISAMVDRLRAC